MDKDKQIKIHMAELVKLCQEKDIIETNDTVKVKDRQYYATFKFRVILDEECPRCKGRGKIPLKD